MHKFILGENPISDGSSGYWIIHLPNPLAIIEVVHVGEKTHSKKAVFVKDYIYGEDEHIQLRLHHYFTTDPVAVDKRAIAMLDHAWHWYCAYLRWEDDNFDLNEIANEN